MIVNKLSFIVSFNCGIKLCTDDAITTRSGTNILTVSKYNKAVYADRGFKVSQMMTNSKFKRLYGDIPLLYILLNNTTNDNNIINIECFIWNPKEQCFCL